MARYDLGINGHRITEVFVDSKLITEIYKGDTVIWIKDSNKTLIAAGEDAEQYITYNDNTLSFICKFKSVDADIVDLKIVLSAKGNVVQFDNVKFTDDFGTELQFTSSTSVSSTATPTYTTTFVFGEMPERNTRYITITFPTSSDYSTFKRYYQLAGKQTDVKGYRTLYKIDSLV